MKEAKKVLPYHDMIMLSQPNYFDHSPPTMSSIEKEMCYNDYAHYHWWLSDGRGKRLFDTNMENTVCHMVARFHSRGMVDVNVKMGKKKVKSLAFKIHRNQTIADLTTMARVKKVPKAGTQFAIRELSGATRIYAATRIGDLDKEVLKAGLR